MFDNPGANHAPHHAPQEYIDKYKGKFDDGYDAYRTWVLARMVEKDMLPKDTKLTPINPLPESMALAADHVRPWDTLNEDEKRLFAQMAESSRDSRNIPTRRSAASSTTRRFPDSSRTPSSSMRGQRHLRRRHTERIRQRE